MPAAALKKKARPEPPPGPVIADDRLPLFDAIERRKQADAAVEAKLETIARARANIEAAGALLEKARAAVPKAREIDAATAATNSRQGATCGNRVAYFKRPIIGAGRGERP